MACGYVFSFEWEREEEHFVLNWHVLVIPWNRFSDFDVREAEKEQQQNPTIKHALPMFYNENSFGFGAGAAANEITFLSESELNR